MGMADIVPLDAVNMYMVDIVPLNATCRAAAMGDGLALPHF
jgi:hypothetical protein